MADGVDAIRRLEVAQRIVGRYVSKDYSLCTVDGQRPGEDHCGSSAVLIGLEFLRLMEGGAIEFSLILSVRIKRRLVSEMHPFRSKRLNGSSRI